LTVLAGLSHVIVEVSASYWTHHTR